MSCAFAVVVARETIELGFLALIQILPARQRAVLILRDILEFSAQETADALERTRRRRTAGTDGGREVRGLAREVLQEAVVDLRLAPRDQRAQLRDVDEVQVALAEDRELDARVGPGRHGRQL